MSRVYALQIATSPDGAALSPAQKRFNTLIRQIEQARQTLSAWQDNVVAYRQGYAEILTPLRDKLMANHRQWVLALDAALDRSGWTKAERTLLRELLCEAASEVLGGSGEDEVVKALHDKHAEVDFDTERRDTLRHIKSLAEAVTGLDLGEGDDIDDDEDFLARLNKGLLEQREAAQARRGAAAARRPKSATQRRREAEAKEATQSVREIYRRLASALHPDRETDERQREAKTALMQRVNQAYEAQDLLALLQLQLQIEQIDESHIATASEARLKQYNKVLGEQSASLKAEIAHAEECFCMEFGIGHRASLDPLKLGQVLNEHKRQWLAELAEQERCLAMLNDTAATKRWLKGERQRRRGEVFGF